MIVTTLFAHEAEVFRIENDIIEYILTDISIAFVAQHLFANSGTWVTKVHVKAVLVAVQRYNSQFVRIMCKADARNISIGIHRYLHFTCHFRFNIKRMYRHFRVSFSGLWIFIGVISRILFESCDMRIASCKDGKTVRGDLCLIKTDISNHLAVGTEFQCTVEGELFFIYPIGNTIQYGITFTILCHLTFTVTIQEFDQINVVIPHEGNHSSIR